MKMITRKSYSSSPGIHRSKSWSRGCTTSSASRPFLVFSISWSGIYVSRFSSHGGDWSHNNFSGAWEQGSMGTR